MQSSLERVLAVILVVEGVGWGGGKVRIKQKTMYIDRMESKEPSGTTIFYKYFFCILEVCWLAVCWQAMRCFPP